MNQLQLPFYRKSNEPLVLVDVMNLAFRAHFRFKHLVDAAGNPTGVYYGFLRSALLLKDFEATIILCWDGGLPGCDRVTNWRNAYYQEYKANRKKTADRETVFAQLARLRKVVRWLGWANCGCPGLEGDDIMGVLSVKTQRKVYLYTTDHDLYQLLEGERVRIIQGARKEGKYKIITQRQAEDEYGFPITQFPAYLALGGDHSDNIHPLPKVGEVRAKELVQAGARPDRSFLEQSSAFRREFAKYQPYWDGVQAAYRVAHIPRSIRDARIKSFVQAELPIESGSRLPLQERRQKFIRFCAVHDLREFLAQRGEFFR